MPRGLTAIPALRAAGVNVAAGADNLQDPFNPVGRACPFETAGLMIMAAHDLPDQAWRSVSDAPARAMGRRAELAVGAGADLVAQLGPNTAILITRGPHGMSLFEPQRPVMHIPAQAREVYDVTGAGDTVAGTMALTLAVGGNLETASRLATLAAAIVVAKVGTATCTHAELQASRDKTGW